MINNPNGNPAWVKGVSQNPAGRPSTARKELLDAMKTVEAAERKTLLTHLVERAFKDDTVLIALARKILPDMTEALLTGDGLNIYILPAGQALPKELTVGLDNKDTAVSTEIH